jgi:diguanylate cyclase (GGDEF)-like protein/PAS domain S-box-containing protein
VSNGRGPVGALPRDAVFRAALESAAAGMSVVDSDLRYRWVNVALCVMLDRPKEELLSLSAADTVHPEHLGRALAFYERLRRGDFGAVRERFMFHRAIGDPIWADVGGSVLDDSKPLFLVQQFDVTAEQQLTEQLAYRAMHDDLTGLATRALLYDRLDAVLGRSRRAGTRAAVFYLDVDDFKSINDTYGHTVGDIVLSETARRLTTVVRGGDTVARVGGDEFVVAGEVTGAGEAKQMAERLGQVLRPRMNVGGRSLPVSVSIGVALNAPLDGPDEILARADSALLRAKRLPRPDGGPEATAGR